MARRQHFEHYDYLTQQLWKANCVSGSAGMTVFAPNGTQYDMIETDTESWLVRRSRTAMGITRTSPM
jgi:hypothetical protein